MSFLDDLAEEADCEACPTPHSVCLFSLCAMCCSCPTATAKRLELRAQVEAYQRGSAIRAHQR